MTDSERVKVLLAEVSACLRDGVPGRACAELGAAIEAVRLEERERCLKWLEDSKNGAYRNAAKQMREALHPNPAPGDG